MANYKYDDAGLHLPRTGGEVHVVHPVFDVGDSCVGAVTCAPDQVYYDEKAGLFYLLVKNVLKVLKVNGEEVKTVHRVLSVSSFIVNRDDSTSIVARRMWKKKLHRFFVHINVFEEAKNFCFSMNAESNAKLRVFTNELLLVSDGKTLNMWPTRGSHILYTSFHKEILFVDVVDDDRLLVSLVQHHSILILDRSLFAISGIRISFPFAVTDILPVKLIGDQFFVMGGGSLGKVSLAVNKEQWRSVTASVISPVEMGSNSSPPNSNILASFSNDGRLAIKLRNSKGKAEVMFILLKPTLREFVFTYSWNHEFLIVDGPPRRNSHNYFLFNGRHLCWVEAKGTAVSWMQTDNMDTTAMMNIMSDALMDRDIGTCMELLIHMTCVMEYSCHGENVAENWALVQENADQFLDLVYKVMKIFKDWKLPSTVQSQTAEQVYSELKKSFKNDRRVTLFDEGIFKLRNSKLREQYKSDMFRLFVANIEDLFSRFITKLESFSIIVGRSPLVDGKKLLHLVERLKDCRKEVRKLNVFKETNPGTRSLVRRDGTLVDERHNPFKFDAPSLFIFQVLKEWHPSTIRNKLNAVSVFLHHLEHFFPRHSLESVIDKAEEVGKKFKHEVKEIFLRSKSLFVVCLTREMLRRWGAIDPDMNETFTYLMAALTGVQEKGSLPNERNWTGCLLKCYDTPIFCQYVMNYSIEELHAFDCESREMMKAFSKLSKCKC